MFALCDQHCLQHNADRHVWCRSFVEATCDPTNITPLRAEFLHVKPGKGAAFVRSKLKNYVTGNTVERTFRAGESVGTADIERIDTQFTYGEGDTVRRMPLPDSKFAMALCSQQPTSASKHHEVVLCAASDMS